MSDRRSEAGEILMRKYLFPAGSVVVTLAIGLAFPHFRAFGQRVNSTDPIFRRWTMDQNQSVNNRRGDHATYPTPHVRTFLAEGDGLRNTLSNSPNSAPAYSYSAKFDGQDHPDPRGRKDQTLAHWRLAPDLIVRLQKTNGKP